MSRIAYTFSTAIVASPAAAVETVVATCGPISPVVDGSPIQLFYSVLFNIGASGSGYRVNIRQGTNTAGLLLIGTNPVVNAPAANAVCPSGIAFDIAPGADQQYALTLTMFGATGASVVSQLLFIAIAL